MTVIDRNEKKKKKIKGPVVYFFGRKSFENIKYFEEMLSWAEH